MLLKIMGSSMAASGGIVHDANDVAMSGVLAGSLQLNRDAIEMSRALLIHFPRILWRKRTGPILARCFGSQ